MTIYGWDMSHFDSPGIGNAVSQGISFITHKAGGDANDAELGAWWSNVRNLPSSILLGAYWVLYPGNPVGRADAFLARLDSQCPGWRNRDAFILQIDAEIWGGDTDTRPSIAECNAFADRLWGRTNGKYTPVGYLPKWVYGNVGSFDYPVWASSYVTASGGFKGIYPGDGSSKWNGYGRTVSILQYSSSATIGGQTTCDANAFRGTIEQLKTLVTPGWAPPTNGIEDEMSAADAMQGFANALAAMATAADNVTTNDDDWGRQAGANLNKILDFDAAVSPLADAVKSLTALVLQQSSASVQDIAEALAPLITVPAGASKQDMKDAIREVLGSLDGTP